MHQRAHIRKNTNPRTSSSLWYIWLTRRESFSYHVLYHLTTGSAGMTYENSTVVMNAFKSGPSRRMPLQNTGCYSDSKVPDASINLVLQTYLATGTGSLHRRQPTK